MNTEDVDKKIQGLLRVFEMENWKDELVESYSHGMRQRIVMSAALIHEPKAIIIDEPMVGLDPKGARLVKEIFKEQAQDRGVSIFMSTHTLEIAEEVCDRIAIIQEGRVIAEGTASDLKKRAGGGSYERLEAAFLRLTGGEDVRDIIEVLRH